MIERVHEHVVSESGSSHGEGSMRIVSRRDLVRIGLTGGLGAIVSRNTRDESAMVAPQGGKVSRDAPTGRIVKIAAKPDATAIDIAKTVVIVIDMQNDFGAKGGMFDRAGMDISGIQKAVGPIARVLASARAAGIKIVYLKMGYRPDLSDLGAPDSLARLRSRQNRVGETIRAPDGRESRILIRDTWNTEIVTQLTPQATDLVIYKSRFSGFYRTDLDARLEEMSVRHLIVTGCTTSVCVESTVRDAMFRDYLCVLLEDCMSEPIGQDFPRSNHDASLLVVEERFGWVSSSAEFVRALELHPA
jgi:ureidoacrylate peracid hydrolase